MIRVFIIAMSLLVSLTLSAQQTGIQPADPAFIAKYANFDFKGNFAAAIDKDAANNYFLLDFSKLNSRFERVYFMNLSFSYDEIINIDPDIYKNRVCFMSHKNYSEADVLKIFDAIREKVLSAATSWSEDKQSQWLNVNDKYK
jgi:hypothetical protein